MITLFRNLLFILKSKTHARLLVFSNRLEYIKLQIPLSPISEEYSKSRFNVLNTSFHRRVKSLSANRGHVRNYHTTHIFVETDAARATCSYRHKGLGVP